MATQLKPATSREWPDPATTEQRLLNAFALLFAHHIGMVTLSHAAMAEAMIVIGQHIQNIMRVHVDAAREKIGTPKTAADALELTKALTESEGQRLALEEVLNVVRNTRKPQAPFLSKGIFGSLFERLRAAPEVIGQREAPSVAKADADISWLLRQFVRESSERSVEGSEQRRPHHRHEHLRDEIER